MLYYDGLENLDAMTYYDYSAIVVRIGESLDLAEIDEIQQLWIAEAIRRHDEVRSGHVQLIPGDEVLAEARRIVGR